MQTDPHESIYIELESQNYGLSKREYFSALILQGVIAGQIGEGKIFRAEYAVEMADALIKQLNITDNEEV
jgi:hypothetical protein